MVRAAALAILWAAPLGAQVNSFDQFDTSASRYKSDEETIRDMAANPATANSWNFVAYTDTGSLWFIRVSELVEAWDSGSRTRTAWIKQDHSKDKTVTARRTMLRVTFYCDSDQINFSSVTDYGADGRVLSSREYNEYSRTRVAPETAIEAAMKRVCR